jgi:hypothetical protein
MRGKLLAVDALGFDGFGMAALRSMLLVFFFHGASPLQNFYT